MSVALALAVMGPVALPATAHGAPPEQLVEDEEARGHFERGQAAFAEGDYEAAITQLKAAYAIEEAPILLYAWAQAERLAGDCERAIELYARFLSTSPPKDQQEKARSNIEVCGGDPDRAYVPPPPEATQSEPEVPASPPGPEPDEAEPEPSGPEILGPVLLGGGGALAVTGGILLGVGLSQGQRAVDADTQDEFVDQTDSARGLHTAGLVLLGVGAAVMIGGGVRMGIVGANKRRDVALGPMMLRGGGGIGAVGRF